MAVRLYHFPPSLCSQKVRLALEEKGVEWESCLVDIGIAMENYEPWYARLNPGLVVPTLEHDGDIVTDSARIVRYVDDQFDGPPLTPSGDEERERMEHWIQRIDAFNFRGLSYGNVPSALSAMRDQSFDKRRKKIRSSMEEAPDLRDVFEAKLDDIDQWEKTVQTPAEVDAIEDELHDMLDELDATLRPRKWVAGPDYSLADILVTIGLGRIHMIGFGDLIDDDEYPAVAEYYARVGNRPSFRHADVWERMRITALLVLFLRAIWIRMIGSESPSPMSASQPD